MHAQGRRKGAVLVHCYAGQSRSVAFVLAYLCAHQGLSLADAYALVLMARPCAKPNAGLCFFGPCSCVQHACNSLPRRHHPCSLMACSMLHLCR